MKVMGHVTLRSDPNPNMPTGQVEVVVEDIQVLNSSSVLLPFSGPLTECNAHLLAWKQMATLSETTCNISIVKLMQYLQLKRASKRLQRRRALGTVYLI